MCGDVWMRGLVCVSAVGGGVKVGWSRSEKCVLGGGLEVSCCEIQ